MLAGVKVLDLTRVLAGPYCTMMLGDLGATIMKVERPGTGDDTRGWGPPFDSRGESAYFLAVNRNKLSIAANLADPEDRSLVDRLIGEADVVVENFLPGARSRLGLDPAAILEQNPGLIWCSISGFGDVSERPGYDFVVQAECGWMAVTGDPDGPPTKTGVAFADLSAGKDAAIAILAALLARERSELPAAERHLRISLAASATAMLANVAQNALVTGRDVSRWGNAHPNLVPYQLFDAADRSIIIAVGSDAQWTACARALGLHDLADDGSLHTNAGRVGARDRVTARIASAVRRLPAQHWLDELTAAGIPCGLVKSVAEVVTAAGGSPQYGLPPSVPGSVRRAPPRLDEHGDAIRRIGWASADL